VRFVAVRVAAVALVVVAVNLYTKYSTPKHIPVPAHTYSTRVGERAIVDLSDGSRVTLAPHSSLTIAEGFGESVRRVDLVGEGYFVIAHNVQTPFVVHSGTVTTRVLGTEFDLKHYPGDRDVRVAVVSGLVASAGSHGAGLTLGAGAVGRLTDSTGIATAISDTVLYTGWMQGSLKFRDTPVPEVLRTLEQWYSVRFRLEDKSLVDATLSGQLDYSSSTNMLATLRTLLNVSMTLQESGNTTVVTLRAARGAAGRGAQDFHLPREVGFR
jgi:ferric-dicitrate binding protein FerR (iron transport regulator)